MLLCIGHRGAMGYAPENTLKSIAKALELGTHWIEIDVYHIDNHLMVIHDDQLERTTNGSGSLMNKSFKYLRTLDAGDGEKIPTLDEVFDLIDQQAGVNIELKGPNTAEPTVTLIQKKCDKGWDIEKFLISSFNHPEIVKTKKLNQQIRTGALICGFPLNNAEFAEKMGAYSVHQSLEFINHELVMDAHRRQLRVFVYTVNQPEEIENMIEMGVDGVFTNYPDRVLQYKEFNQ